MTSFDPSSPDVWRMRVLDDLVSWAADCHREKVAWVFDSQPERQWTFTQIHRVVRHLAHWLAQRCPTPGDRVVLMVPNEAAFPSTWLACASAGLVTVPRVLPTLGPAGMRSHWLMTLALRWMGNLVTDEDRDAAAAVWRWSGRRSVARDSRPPFA